MSLEGDEEAATVLVEALQRKSEVERATHGFHTWPAGLHPDAARDLVSAFGGPRVLDPFCGGGTVLVEARIAGRQAIGRDLSKVALRIARARTSTADEAVLTRMRSASRKVTETARFATEWPPDHIARALQDWYAEHTLAELEAIRQAGRAADPDIRYLLAAVFSSILVKTSWRESDTSARRLKHHRPPGTAAILFHKKARELGRKIAELRALVPPGTPEADIELGDARDIRIDGPVDAVITSPPYPSTYDYLPLQHLRRVWFEDPGDEDEYEIGARRSFRDGHKGALREWIGATREWMQSAADQLVPGGRLVIVIGDGIDPAGTIDTRQPTIEAARAAGLQLFARASVERNDFARESVRWEHAFVFVRATLAA